MASKVLSMSDATVQKQSEEKVQTKPLVRNITPVVQRAATRTRGSVQANGNLESRLNSSKSGGSPLPNQVRSFMEPRFGADFSRVRVHTDNTAVQMNRELGAQAFTHGSNIYYGEGKAPGNNELTAHELTHVVQQTGRVKFQQNPKQEDNEKTLSLIPLVQQNITSLCIQRWALPTDWLDYIGLTIDVAERVYIELGYKEGEEKDFKRFVNNLFIVIDIIFAATPGAGGGGLGLRVSRSGGAAVWAATPDSLKLKVAEEVAKRMAWSTVRALQMINIYFSATEGGGKTKPLEATTVDSKKYNKLTERIAEHLARLLRLPQVGGIPPGEDPDPGKNNDNHWWKEIKTFIKNAQQAAKGATRKQVMKALREKFTEEQILDIEKRLIEAAKKMEETKPEFLPLE